MHIITRLILGGAQENTLLSVLGQMREPETTVRLVCGPTAGPEGSLVDEARAAGVDYVEAPTLTRPVSPVDDWRAYRELRRLIREWRPDVVHTHSSKAGVLGRLAAWKERTPLVTHTIHGLPFHPYQGWWPNTLYKWAERLAAGRCHRLISVADAMTEQAVAAGVAPREKFVTVYSGMKVEPFLDDSRDLITLRARFGLSPNDLVIGKVARLFELKGHEYLLEAFAQIAADHQNARLLLVGDGIWREKFERQVAHLGIAERVVFAGLIPHDQVADAIAAMDVVVHCSLREGLARVLPQALLAAKPVISFDVDGAREVVIDGQTGRLVPPRDVAALTRALRETLADLDTARAWAQAGRKLCRERFDWRVMVERLLEIYREGVG